MKSTNIQVAILINNTYLSIRQFNIQFIVLIKPIDVVKRLWAISLYIGKGVRGIIT